MRFAVMCRVFAAAACVLLVLASATAQAGIFRAYLSSQGSDANPCTLPSPCRLLPAALVAVNDGGEIWMLDSANYNTGPVNITKSVNILAIPGALGSVVGNGGDAIVINGANVNVSLRNLVVLNLAGGTTGITLTNGARLGVEGCEIYGFSSNGIFVNTPAKVSIADTVIRDNGFGGIVASSGAVQITRTRVTGNGNVGIYAVNFSGMLPSPTTVNVSVADSVVSGNLYGFYVLGDANFNPRVVITRSVTSNNNVGIFANLNGADVVLFQSTVSGNVNAGLQNSGSGAIIESWGGNVVTRNGTNTSGSITTGTPL